MFFKSKPIATYLEQSAAVEMIMGATHDIKILDFPFFSGSCWIIFVGSYCIGRRHGPRLMNGQIIGGNS